MAEKILIEVEVDSTNAEKTLSKTNKQTEKLATSTDDVGKAAKKSEGSIKGLTKGFNAMNAALGVIGLIVAAFIALKKALQSSEEGQDRYNKIMAVLGSVLGNITDIVSVLATNLLDLFQNPQQALNDFGDLIKENIVNRFNGLLELLPQLGKAIGLLFEGEFSQAAEVAGNALGKVALGVDDIVGKTKSAIEATKEFVAEIIEEGKVAAKLSDTRGNLDRIERRLLVDRAKANRAIAEARAKAADKDNVSAEDRIKALEEAAKIEKEITKREIDAQEMRVANLKEQNKLSNSNKEDLDAVAQAEAELINLQTASANNQKALIAGITAAKRDAAAEEKAIIKEKADLEKTTEEARLKSIKDIAKAEELSSAKQLKDAKAASDGKIALAKSVGQGIAAIGALIAATQEEDSKKAFEINKGFAIANSLINTALGVTVALSSAAPPINFITAGAVGIAGLAQTLVISKQEYSNASVKSTPKITPPNVNYGAEGTLGDTSPPSFGSSQLNDTINGSIGEPIKAYVVASDVTSQQALDRQTASNATL